MDLWGNIMAINSANRTKEDEEQAARNAFMQQLLMSDKNYDSQATLGAWDSITPWKTGNEKAVEINKRLMGYQPGADETLINDYYSNNAETIPYKAFQKLGQMGDSFADAYTAPQGDAGDLRSKYFPSAEPAQPFTPSMNRNPRVGNTQEFPSVLEPEDNATSFWEYLKKQR